MVGKVGPAPNFRSAALLTRPGNGSMNSGSPASMPSSATPILGDARIGVVVRGLAVQHALAGGTSMDEAPIFSWERRRATKTRTRCPSTCAAGALVTARADGGRRRRPGSDDRRCMADRRAAIATRSIQCPGRPSDRTWLLRAAAAWLPSPARLWVVVDFGEDYARRCAA